MSAELNITYVILSGICIIAIGLIYKARKAVEIAYSGGRRFLKMSSKSARDIEDLIQKINVDVLNLRSVVVSTKSRKIKRKFNDEINRLETQKELLLRREIKKRELAIEPLIMKPNKAIGIMPIYDVKKELEGDWEMEKSDWPEGMYGSSVASAGSFSGVKSISTETDETKKLREEIKQLKNRLDKRKEIPKHKKGKRAIQL